MLTALILGFEFAAGVKLEQKHPGVKFMNATKGLATSWLLVASE